MWIRRVAVLASILLAVGSAACEEEPGQAPGSPAKPCTVTFNTLPDCLALPGYQDKWVQMELESARAGVLVASYRATSHDFPPKSTLTDVHQHLDHLGWAQAARPAQGGDTTRWTEIAGDKVVLIELWVRDAEAIEVQYIWENQSRPDTGFRGTVNLNHFNRSAASGIAGAERHGLKPDD